jgi:hypothetical protein
MRKVIYFLLIIVIMGNSQAPSIEDIAKMEAYEVEHSKTYFFSISDFELNMDSISISLDSGYCVLGNTEKGFTEAIIIPEKSLVKTPMFHFWDFDMELNNEIDNLYLRFNPEWYNKELSEFLTITSFKESVFNKALEIHKEKFKNWFHIGWKAFIPPENDLGCDFNILPSGLRFGIYLTPNIEKPIIRGDWSSNLDILWNEYKNENFVIYYPDNSVIKESLNEWLKPREKAYRNICDFLDISEEICRRKVTFYVFNSMEHGDEYGYKLGFAEPEQDRILTMYNQTPGHELAHVISYRINGKRINSALINEGLATSLDQSGRNYDRISKYLIEEGWIERENLYNLLGESFREEKFGYPLGASFVRYVMEKYSISKFKEFFAQEELTEEDAFKHYYGKSGRELIDEWRNDLVKKDYGKLTEREQEYIKILNKYGI